KEKAFRILRSRLLQMEQERAQAELSGERRSQVGTGERSEKIRTYNYKENRVTDHRIGLTIRRLDKVLEGDLDECVEALAADQQAKQHSAGRWPPIRSPSTRFAVSVPGRGTRPISGPSSSGVWTGSPCSTWNGPPPSPT